MNKDLDITPFPSVKEFAIGAMLPQCGSREGMSSDKRNILEVLLDDEEYMKETSFSDVKKIVDSFSREDLLKFSPSGRFVNSPNCIYRNVIKVGKYGGFIEVYKMSNSKNVGFISIAVQNEAQGNGIGTRLVNEMISNISGIDTLVWRCEKNNNASNNLAKKCGFKLSSETKNTNTYKLQLHNIEESGTSSDVDRIINTFTKNELKEFAPNGNPDNHINNVIYRDVKKVNGVPVAFIEVDQHGDDKKNKECNISVGCDPKYRGNGYTKELLSKFIKTQGYKYNKIWYGYKKTNIGSKKLVESIGGFKNVGGKEGMEWQTLEIKESALSADDRNNIKTKDFGLPDQRKYPMHDKEHVLLAIKFFNYCPAKDKDELAKNIIEKIDYYFDEGEKMNIKIGDKNSFKKYWSNNINEGYFSDLNIELEEYGEPILDDYKYTNKPTQDGFIDKRGTWGSIIKYKNNYFRERVEALIIDGDKIFLAFIPDGVNNNFYKIPGGSSEKDGSLTNQLQNECNEEAKIKIKNPKYILSYMKKYQNGDYWDSKHRYYGAITHLYIAEYNGRYTGIVDEVDLAPKILKYGRFYKIDDIFEKLRPVHKVALLSKDNKYKVKTENVVENTYFKLDYDNMEAFYEEVLHKQDLYPVFICSFEYESSYKKIIKAFTGSRFTHSGISFNAKLSEIFSFVKDAISGDHVGGFYIEDIKDVKLSNYNNSIKIDVVFVNKKQYDKMQKFIRKLYHNINNSNYNVMNLLNIAFNKPTTVNEMNMVCSTFVAYIFEIAGIKLVDNKDTTLVTPADIASTEKKYIHTLFNDKGMNLDLRQINKNLVFTYNKLYNDKYNLNTSYLTNKGFYK